MYVTKYTMEKVEGFYCGQNITKMALVIVKTRFSTKGEGVYGCGGVLSLKVNNETHPHTPTIYHFHPHTNKHTRINTRINTHALLVYICGEVFPGIWNLEFGIGIWNILLVCVYIKKKTTRIGYYILILCTCDIYVFTLVG